jgi:hypothetical protein
VLRVWLLAPPLFSGVGSVSVPLPPPLLVLDYSSLFKLFSFAGVGFSLPRAVMDYFLGDWVGELSVVCDDHLFILQLHKAALGPAVGKNDTTFFSVAWHREASMSYRPGCCRV